MKFYSINQLKPFLERNITIKMNTTLHAYLVTFENKKFEIPKPITKMVLAYDKKEAGDIFVKWLKAVDLYKDARIMCVQTTRKTKRNKRYITREYYEKQNAHVSELYDAYLRKVAC